VVLFFRSKQKVAMFLIGLPIVVLGTLNSPWLVAAGVIYLVYIAVCQFISGFCNACVAACSLLFQRCFLIAASGPVWLLTQSGSPKRQRSAKYHVSELVTGMLQWKRDCKSLIVPIPGGYSFPYVGDTVSFNVCR
jgi:hypothetical protein